MEQSKKTKRNRSRQWFELPRNVKKGRVMERAKVELIFKDEGPGQSPWRRSTLSDNRTEWWEVEQEETSFLLRQRVLQRSWGKGEEARVGGYSKEWRWEMQSLNIQEHLVLVRTWNLHLSGMGKARHTSQTRKKKKKHGLTLRKRAWHGERGLTMGEMGSEMGKWV